MVLSTLIGFGVIFGAGEGFRSAQAKARREEHRSRKNNLIVHVPKSSEHSPLLEGRRVVLSGNKLYIDTGRSNNTPFGHPFAGYYLPYPEARYPGLVSTITHTAPIMNWIFIDANTYEVKFGIRKDSEGNLTGPWDCTRQDRRMTFMGWEGFVAVQEGPFWALYFDYDGDGLKGKGIKGDVIEVELWRREMKTEKPPPPDPELLKELMAKQEAERLAKAQQAGQTQQTEQPQDPPKKTPAQFAAEQEAIAKATLLSARAKARADASEQSAAAAAATSEKLPKKNQDKKSKSPERGKGSQRSDSDPDQPGSAPATSSTGSSSPARHDRKRRGSPGSGSPGSRSISSGTSASILNSAGVVTQHGKETSSQVESRTGRTKTKPAPLDLQRERGKPRSKSKPSHATSSSFRSTSAFPTAPPIPPSTSPTSPNPATSPFPPRQFLTPKTPRTGRPPRRQSESRVSAGNSAPRVNRERPPASNVREMVRRFRTEDDTLSSDESARPASMSSLESLRPDSGQGNQEEAREQ